MLNFDIQVPFFIDDEETPSTPKTDTLFIPKENPRALVIRPLEQWPPRTNVDKSSPLKDTSSPTHENGKFFLYFKFGGPECAIFRYGNNGKCVKFIIGAGTKNYFACIKLML